MHICFLSQEFPRRGVTYGGIGTFLLTFSTSLIQKGHQVTVVGILGDDFIDEVIDGVRIVTFPRSQAKLIGWWRNFSRISKFLKELHLVQPIDIIEGSELTFAFLDKIPGIPFVIRLHGGHHFFAEGEKRPINKWKGLQEKISFKKADAFIAVSEYVKSHTGKLLSFGEKPIRVINYPVSLQKFYKSDPKNTIPFRLVFAGTVCEKKGIRQLILSLGKVSSHFPEIHLEVYGRDWFFQDGKSYVQFLKEEIDPELLKRVNFHGPVSHDDLPKYYEQAELCIFPSHMETQGLVAPEAMAMGKPVIFSKTGPGPETIDHRVNGWLCDPHSSENIADTIIEALSSRENLEKIGEEARKKVFGKFDPQKITELNLDYYKTLASSI
ncbi:glycosyltransferase involved in cell wall biosynthesis [Algoriphagus boseongensis]|uniref:Glycosyltransferase involved in cell wall biosynthesis n=1 Tax=Algoriphagus boseongensis TaxID=1442587 RepID=A0A4R6T969_9BACT|nr:glycosyltransferase family 4 protein [Algoriphagus boseongensis]TDQ19620.1 glycosyltransferase involved in cell wall biosynthesis [Algoriphagus boseongensis]